MTMKVECEKCKVHAKMQIYGIGIFYKKIKINF